MGKQTVKMVFLVLSLLLVLLCGTTFALMFRQTNALNNQFQAAVVDCEVSEEFDGTEKSQICVTNTGNIEAYLRVRLVTYWVEGEEKIVAKPSQMPSLPPVSEGWVEKNDIYYYKYPVAPRGKTPPLFTGKIVLQQDENDYCQVIEVFADAIQSKPAEAVKESWGVNLVAAS